MEKYQHTLRHFIRYPRLSRLRDKLNLYWSSFDKPVACKTNGILYKSVPKETELWLEVIGLTNHSVLSDQPLSRVLKASCCDYFTAWVGPIPSAKLVIHVCLVFGYVRITCGKFWYFLSGKQLVEYVPMCSSIFHWPVYLLTVIILCFRAARPRQNLKHRCFVRKMVPIWLHLTTHSRQLFNLDLNFSQFSVSFISDCVKLTIHNDYCCGLHVVCFCIWMERQNIPESIRSLSYLFSLITYACPGLSCSSNRLRSHMSVSLLNSHQNLLWIIRSTKGWLVVIIQMGFWLKPGKNLQVWM